MYEIYLITNQINEMKYVGKSEKGLEWRLTQHRKDAKSGSPYYLHRAMRKYGYGRFTVSLLATAKNSEDLTRLEKFWIAALGTKAPLGYNMTDGGEGTSGYVMSEEIRRKISIAAKGKNLGKLAGTKSPFFRHDIDTEYIVSLYRGGKSVPDISKLLGVRPETLRHRLKSAGVVFRPLSEALKMAKALSPPNPTRFRKDLSTKEMVSLLERRFTYQEIADKLGCSMGCVKKRLKKEGISNLHNRTRVNRQNVVDSYTKSGSVQRVAKDFKISTTTVHRILTESKTPRLGRGVFRLLLNSGDHSQESLKDRVF